MDISGGITLDSLRELDALADAQAVARYHAMLTALRAQGLTPFVTLNHFSLPLWIHDPIAARDALASRAVDDPVLPPIPGPAGWLDPAIAAELAKYAAYVGWKLGPLVDFWLPLNEPVVTALNGYLNVFDVKDNFPPAAHRANALPTELLQRLGAH